MTMRMAVTGAGGFLGSAVVEHAKRRGVDVIGSGRKTRGAADVAPADILDGSSLDPVFAAADVVVHAAGLAHAPGAPAREFERTNVEGTRNVMAAAARAGVRRVVLVSSVSVYGGGEADTPDESRACRPSGPYAESKLAAERVAGDMAAERGVELVVLRMATIFGEGDRGNVARLVRALGSRRFVWIGDGSNRKSLVYRGDAAEACLDAAVHAPNGAFNVAAPPVTMRAIVEGICAALGRRSPRARIPARAARAAARAADSALKMGGARPRFEPTIAKWLSEEVFSAARFEAEARWAARTSLDEGLRRQVDGYLERAGVRT